MTTTEMTSDFVIEIGKRLIGEQLRQAKEQGLEQGRSEVNRIGQQIRIMAGTTFEDLFRFCLFNRYPDVGSEERFPRSLRRQWSI